MCCLACLCRVYDPDAPVGARYRRTGAMTTIFRAYHGQAVLTSHGDILVSGGCGEGGCMHYFGSHTTRYVPWLYAYIHALSQRMHLLQSACTHLGLMVPAVMLIAAGTTVARNFRYYKWNYSVTPYQFSEFR